MGRAPCCDKANVKRGPWSPEEDATLKSYLETHGTAGNWIALPKKAGLRRCGKSCRLRWLNYLRPDIKHGGFTDEEDTIICTLYAQMGSRWSAIASQLPGRTDNDVKNYWNTKLKKKIMAGTVTLKPLTENKDIGLASTPSPTHQNVKSTQKYSADFPASQNQINSPPSPPLPILDNNNYDVASSGFNNIDELKNMGFDQIHQLYSPRVLMDVVSSEIGANYANSSNNNNNNVPMGSLSQDGSSIISDSSSNIAVNNNCVSLPAEEYAHAGETLIDFGFGFPNYDYVNNGLNNCHERVGDFNAAGCCYPEWVDFSYADMKPH